MKIDKCFLNEELIDTDIEIQGWIQSVRRLKKFSFVVINDGSTQSSLQVVVDKEISPDVIELIGTGSSVEIQGKLVKSQGKGQGVELVATKLVLVGNVDESYPLQKKASSFEFLREQAHLRARTQTFRAVFKIRHQLSFSTHQFFHSKGLHNIHTPIITSSDCEGAGELLRVTSLNVGKPPLDDSGNIDWAKDFFKKGTYLTVSGQLNAESLALGLGGVYTFGPTFRAEDSHTPRHLAEFWMVEPEVAFMDLVGVSDLARDYLKHSLKWVLDNCEEELSFLQEKYKPGLVDTLKNVVEKDFTRITYTEAVDVLKKSDVEFEYPVEWGSDLQTEHERYLAEKKFGGPVIVTDYPKVIKAFYMKQNEDNKTVRAMDILLPGVGEIVGGSQREDDFDLLTKRIEAQGLPVEEYRWYLDLRKFGGVPHSGFGLGFDRLVMYATGMSNIRDVIPFPRAAQLADF